ncbi:helix-turn-helix domain-containing protein [Pantoea cypripedii]|uniref:helix-turn-helix domain-containing protein n=1 Tax=Pantoea cypripedii TaxID=55209 RepID=UPI001ABFCA0E|nr:LysR family transcriptional regulator [Pantoea cypripedii]
MKLEDIDVFVQAVQTGSLAGAARRLALSSMAASRSLNNLEAELGVRLVHRTTRALALTSDGERFFAACTIFA